MKKKQIANIVMVAIILVIVIAGVLMAGHIQGWFDKNDGEAAVLMDVRGTVNLQREGVAYPVQEETVLRAGDVITCKSNATARIVTADGYLALGEKAGMEVTDSSARSFAATVTGGEVFVNAASTVTLSFDGKEAAFTDAVASLSVRSGAQSISVFAGIVEDAAGQVLDWVGDTLSVLELSITTLNDFNIEQICAANEDKVLCFTNADLDQLKADRLAEMQAQQTEPAEPEETVPETRPEETVFDVLTRACSNYGIQIEYSWTPMYGSYYIEGIHHLYEFDCGYESGWMYKVNGWFPNYGCSSYTLSDGDNIVWCYTCNGLGADVGA